MIQSCHLSAIGEENGWNQRAKECSYSVYSLFIFLGVISGGDMKTIKERVERIAAAKDEIEGAQFILKEGLVASNAKSQRALVWFYIVSAIWFAIHAGEVKELTLLGAVYTDIPTLLAIMPCIAALMFYQFICHEGVVALTQSALDEMLKKMYPKSHDEKLTKIFYPSASFHIENAIYNIDDSGGRLKRLYKSLLLPVTGVILTLIPLLILLKMFVEVVDAENIPVIINIFSPVLVLFFGLRSLFLLAQWMRTL